MCGLSKGLAVSVCLFIALGSVAQNEAARDQKADASHKMAAKKPALSDSQYVAKALTAAPPAVAKDAGVARIDKDGTMKTLRESKNGYTCVVMLNDVMCADGNSMAFFNAAMKKQPPPDKLGLTYMLRGDQGASNTDPDATQKTADNHWVVTGPHIMLVGAAVKDLGLPTSADADPSKPYIMWAGTPYAHAMIPVAATHLPAAAGKRASNSNEKKDVTSAAQ